MLRHRRVPILFAAAIALLSGERVGSSSAAAEQDAPAAGSRSLASRASNLGAEHGRPLSGKRALLVVGSVRPLSPGDGALRSRLERAGFAVAPVTRPGALAWESDLVVVSATASGLDHLAYDLFNLERPVLALNGGLFAPLGLTGPESGTDFGSTRALEDLDVLPRRPLHPLGAGLGGRVRLSEDPQVFLWATPGPAALAVLNDPSSPGHSLLFAYEREAPLASLSLAPARRVGFSLPEGAAAALTREGQALLDAAILWTAGIDAPPIVDAGADLKAVLGQWEPLRGRIADDGGSAVGEWTEPSGSGTVEFDDPSLPATHIRFSKAGTYTLRLSASDGARRSLDEVLVRVVPRKAASPVGEAWLEQEIEPAPSATLASGPVLLVVGNLTLVPHDTVWRDRLQAMGFRVVVKLASAAKAADATGKKLVVVSATSPNANILTKFRRVAVPVIVQSAGIYDDMNLTAPADRGNVNGSELTILAPSHPMATGLSGTVQVATALVNFAWGRPAASGIRIAAVAGGDPTRLPLFGYEQGAQMVGLRAPARRVIFGVYDLHTLTPEGKALLDAAIGWAARVNFPPVGSAGPDQEIGAPEGRPLTASLAGTVRDDGLPQPPGALSATWSLESGPGTASFSDPGALSTLVTLSDPGTYSLRLTVSDGALSSSDDLVVTASRLVNEAPQVDAGADIGLTLPQPAALSPTVVDDGLPDPPAALSALWSLVSGPGSVSFADPRALASTASFSAEGAYTLRLVVTDGQLTTTDQLVVHVAPPINQPPAVSAGADVETTLAAGAALVGTATDDGRPAVPGALVAAWTKVRGPGAVSFTHPASTSTGATFTARGEYVLRLSVSDGALSGADEVRVLVKRSALQVTSDAGPDAHDQALSGRMRATGFVVTAKRAADATAADAAGKDLVLVGRAVPIEDVRTRFRTCRYP